MKKYIYLYGQILGTYSFLLKNGFLKPDEYSEIKEKYFLPGGETGTAATVLASFGEKIKLDGTHIGRQVAQMIKHFYRTKSVDLSSLTFDKNYEGLIDYVIIANSARSPMGFFQQLYESGEKRWNVPKKKDIAECSVAGIDPFFLEETQTAAEFCVEFKKPYVTIDCNHKSYLHKNCAINIVSNECISSYYKNNDKQEIYELLTENTDGLVIITNGEKPMMWGRKGQKPNFTEPFKVKVQSTLGAGDSFKAGCIYALLHKMTDEQTVRFASACSAVAVSRFPLPLMPPTLDEVNSLLKNLQF